MTLKEYILHQLREARREMLVALEGLTPEDLTSFEPCGHWPIAWIVQHCCGNIDGFLHRAVTGRPVLEHEDRYRKRPLAEPQPGDAYPELPELVERWTSVWDAVLALMEVLGEQELQAQSEHAVEPLVQSCLRVINHTNTHLRNIWTILGERRVDHKFAEQQTWLA